MSLETEFDQLFKECHDYLYKGHELWAAYFPRNKRRMVQDYKRILLNEMHLIDPLLRKYPDLKKSFKYKPESEEFKEAYKIYTNFISSNPKNIKNDRMCMYKVLWESVHISNLLDEISKKISKKSLLEQALVAMCTAHECYARESFQWILNKIPKYAKKYVGSLSIPVKELGKFSFEPLQNAGNIFYDREGQNYKVFNNGKKLYKELVGFNLFKNKRTEMKLWKIFQTRHCIIHNGGKPDLLWKKKTKNARFKTYPSTLNSYINYLHNEFHILWIRLYIHLFDKEPPAYQEKE